VVLEGPALGDIVDFLDRKNEIMEPRLLEVTGDLEVFKPDASGNRRKHGAECCRLGILRNIDGWGV
jgi:hypothetical protein